MQCSVQTKLDQACDTTITGVLSTGINTSTSLCQFVTENYYVVQTFPLVSSARAQEI